MKTIATIITSLFSFLFLAVSMPVQAQWKPYAYHVEYRYTNEPNPIRLIIPCKRRMFSDDFHMYLDVPGYARQYPFPLWTHNVDIQVQFDDNPSFNFMVEKSPRMFKIIDSRRQYFLSLMKMYKRMTIRIQNPLHPDFIVRINLHDFTKVYGSRCT